MTVYKFITVAVYITNEFEIIMYVLLPDPDLACSRGSPCRPLEKSGISHCQN